LKLTTAIAQYLYLHKRLDIPGIGSFILDPSVEITDTEQGKQQKSPVLEGINFENNPAIAESSELVSFLSSQTGKMKALAAADLSSHIELMRQFLNIGKPFLLEGIGSLVKTKAGTYEFTPGSMIVDKLKDIPSKSETSTHTTEEQTYEPFLKKEKVKTAWKRPVALLLVVAGIGFAVWGGYTIYKRNASKSETTESPAVPDNNTISAAANTNLAENVSTQQPVETAPPKETVVIPGQHKFVLEISLQKRAVERYNKLKTFQWPVQMETRDSVQYKLFMLLSSSPADTSRILDSLSALNGRRVYIER
jgi:hypothetical protein